MNRVRTVFVLIIGIGIVGAFALLRLAPSEREQRLEFAEDSTEPREQLLVRIRQRSQFRSPWSSEHGDPGEVELTPADADSLHGVTRMVRSWKGYSTRYDATPARRGIDEIAVFVLDVAAPRAVPGVYRGRAWAAV